MKEPKTKPKAPAPKVLKRSIRTMRGKISLNKSINNFQKTRQAVKALQQPDCARRYDNPEQFATENATEAGRRAIRQVSRKAAGLAKKAAKKGYEKIREHHQTKQQDKADKAFIGDVNSHQASQTGSQAQSHTTAATSKQTAAHRSEKIRQTQGGKQTVKSAIHTGKNSERTVQSAKTSVKNTKRTIKTTRRGVKTAANTAKRTAKAARKAAMIARKAAIAAAKAVKLTVKVIITAIKVAIVTLKTLIAAIAAGGWIVVLLIIVIAVIAAIVASPLAIFTNDSDGTTPTLSEVVQQINGEYSGTITGIIADAGDVDEVIVEGETASSDYTVSNWIDVLGVFSVKSTVTTSDEEFVPLVYMEDTQIDDLKDVFWNMNVISHEIVTETVESDSDSSLSSASPTPEATQKTVKKLVISIDCKTYEQGAQIYGFSDEKMEVLNELMQPDYLPMFMEICGMDTYTGLTSEQITNLLNDLPEGELGSEIVQYALTRLGDPYSKAKRGQGNYVDCSYFARWCYQQAGVTDFTAPTAASQAEYCVDNGLCVSYSDLQPGDLIFWSFKKNGRFMNISHVGIYAGDGYVIDASSSRGMVVYRPVFGESSIVICGRPYAK